MTGWTPLDEGSGTVLAASGAVTAAAQLGMLTVWSDGAQAAHVTSDLPNPARPRIAGRRVYWGPHMIDLDLRTNRTLVPLRVALPGYEQTAHAWAPDGRAAVVAARRTGPAGSSPAVVALLDGEGKQLSVVWESADLAPVALAFGEDTFVIGTRGPRVFDAEGQQVRTLAAETSPFRIEVDAASARVLVAEYAQLGVWDLANGEVLGVRRGTWVDAALTPDGTRLVAVDFAGRVQVHLVDREMTILGEVPADTPALAVAATDDRLVAAFVRVPAIRTVALGLKR